MCESVSLLTDVFEAEGAGFLDIIGRGLPHDHRDRFVKSSALMPGE